MNIDLHIHTTASDGILSPAQIIHEAVKRGMKAIAITDHDSVEGIEEALNEARQFPRLLVIPGVEMGADVPDCEMHVLGYFIDHHSAELSEALSKLRASRGDRGKEMLARLEKLGVKLDWNRVASIAEGGAIGRPHIAQALIEGGHVASITEAFDKYIGSDGPAFVERKKLTPMETVELIARTGGLPVLAHPATMENLGTIIPELKRAGLIGMEVYYKDYDIQTVINLRCMAEKHGLICCGGSDFHGFEEDGTKIGRCDVPHTTIDQLLALRKRA